VRSFSWEGYLNHEKQNIHSDSEEDEFNSYSDVFIESEVEYGNVDDSVYEDF